jgi:hypothetical protein
VSNKVSAATWIGKEYANFERVCRAFELYGFDVPRPDTDGGSGAYAVNIANQYRASLTERQVYAIIDYALTYSLESLLTLQPGDWEGDDIMVSPGRPRKYGVRERVELRLETEALAQIDARTANRTEWIAQAIREKLERENN